MTPAQPPKTARPRRRWGRKLLFVGLVLVFYVVTAVPLGMLVYSVKSELGWNVFKNTGYHGLLACLQQEAAKIEWEQPTLPAKQP